MASCHLENKKFKTPSIAAHHGAKGMCLKPILKLVGQFSAVQCNVLAQFLCGLIFSSIFIEDVCMRVIDVDSLVGILHTRVL